MTKRKKITRAYKVGRSDAIKGTYRSVYPHGTTWASDYNKGFNNTIKTLPPVKLS